MRKLCDQADLRTAQFAVLIQRPGLVVRPVAVSFASATLLQVKRATDER